MWSDEQDPFPPHTHYPLSVVLLPFKEKPGNHTGRRLWVRLRCSVSGSSILSPALARSFPQAPFSECPPAPSLCTLRELIAKCVQQCSVQVLSVTDLCQDLVIIDVFQDPHSATARSTLKMLCHTLVANIGHVCREPLGQIIELLLGVVVPRLWLAICPL